MDSKEVSTEIENPILTKILELKIKESSKLTFYGEFSKWTKIGDMYWRFSIHKKDKDSILCRVFTKPEINAKTWSTEAKCIIRLKSSGSSSRNIFETSEELPRFELNNTTKYQSFENLLKVDQFQRNARSGDDLSIFECEVRIFKQQILETHPADRIGFIDFRVPEFRRVLLEKKWSKELVHSGFVWKMNLEINKDPVTGVHVSAYVHCDPLDDDVLWGCVTDLDIRLLSSNGTMHSFQAETYFNRLQKYSGPPNFIPYGSGAIEPENGYLLDNAARMELHFVIKHKRILQIFNDPFNKLYADACIVINSRKMYLWKQHLREDSKFFDSYFRKYHYQPEFHVPKCITFGEFVDYVNHIRNVYTEITSLNIASLLHCSHRLINEKLKTKCREFLENSGDEVKPLKKLQLAEKYGFEELKKKLSFIKPSEIDNS